MKKLLVLLFIVFGITAQEAKAQYGEPEIQDIVQPKNLFDEGYKTGLGFTFALSDFGFGAGVQLRKGLSAYNEALLTFKIAGLRDPSEQTYIDYYFGNRTIPSKYQRIITFPLSVGLKKRLFASQISDNFRVHTSLSVGPTLAITLPYFRDYNNNGYREADFSRYGFGVEPVLDIFQGWDDSSTEFGWNGEFVLGIDFGDNFARLQTLQFGYTFHYFNNGLQILEPFGPALNENGSIIDDDNDLLPDRFVRTNDPMNYFGSAQITFIIGWMWD